MYGGWRLGGFGTYHRRHLLIFWTTRTAGDMFVLRIFVLYCIHNVSGHQKKSLD